MANHKMFLNIPERLDISEDAAMIFNGLLKPVRSVFPEEGTYLRDTF